MRKKSALDTRTQFARLVAAARAANAVAYGLMDWSVTIEAEDQKLWDDFVETRAKTKTRWQVKRQETPLKKTEVVELLEAIGADEYCLALPTYVPVRGIGELRALYELLRRSQQPGADLTTVVKSSLVSEKPWLASLKKATGAAAEEEALTRVNRLRLKLVGHEPDLREHGIDALTASYGGEAARAFDAINTYFTPPTAQPPSPCTRSSKSSRSAAFTARRDRRRSMSSS